MTIICLYNINLWRINKFLEIVFSFVTSVVFNFLILFTPIISHHLSYVGLSPFILGRAKNMN